MSILKIFKISFLNYIIGIFWFFIDIIAILDLHIYQKTIYSIHEISLAI